MKLNLIREPSNSDTTFGVLWVDDYFECFTLENSHKIIDPGTYQLVKYYSPHNKMDVPLLVQVPGRSEIEIHPANYYTELEGCIAVGTDISKPMLENSRNAFTQLMSKLDWSNLYITIGTLQ